MSKPPKPAKEEDAFTRTVLAVEVEGALKETTGSEVHVDYKGGKGVLHIVIFILMRSCSSSPGCWGSMTLSRPPRRLIRPVRTRHNSFILLL